MDMVGLNEMQSVRPVAWVSFIYAEMLDLGLEIDISGSSIYTRRAIALSGHCPSHTLANRMASPSRWVKCEYSEIFLEQVSVEHQRAWVLRAVVTNLNLNLDQEQIALTAQRRYLHSAKPKQAELEG